MHKLLRNGWILLSTLSCVILEASFTLSDITPSTPGNNQGVLSSSSLSSNGMTLIGGKYGTEPYSPLAYFLSPSGEVIILSIPVSGLLGGQINSSSLESQGNTILGGSFALSAGRSNDLRNPIIYLLDSNGMISSPITPSLPAGFLYGSISCACSSAQGGGRTILAGVCGNDAQPVLPPPSYYNYPIAYITDPWGYVILAIRPSTPYGEQASINCSGLNSAGKTVLAGSYGDLGIGTQPLIYLLDNQATITRTLTPPIPAGARSAFIYSASLDSVGNAVLGGYYQSGGLGGRSRPLIYILDLLTQEIKTVIPDVPHDFNGHIQGSCLGSNGMTFLCGYYYPNGYPLPSLPLIYVMNNAGVIVSTLTPSINSIPAAKQAQLNSCSLDSNGRIILSGFYEDSHFYRYPLIYIISDYALYDIKRIEPIYRNEVLQATELLRRAGL